MRRAGRTPAPPAGPFASPDACLEAWFRALGPMTAASDRHVTGVFPIEEFGLPPTPGGRLQAAFSAAATLLDRASPDPAERCTVWAYPVPDGPGWDSAARVRRALACAVEGYVAADGPASADPLAVLLLCRATAAARLRTVPSGLPVTRAARSSSGPESPGNPTLVERIEPRLDLDGLVLPLPTRQRLAEALAVPAALASLAGTGWGVEETLLGAPNVALLLYGPPGTGKTLFAEARRSGDVVLLDEADSFLTTRERAARAWEATMTNVLLQEIECFRGVVVLTTNRDAVLDPALERRLAARLAFPLPGAAERRLLWLRHLPPRAPRAVEAACAASRRPAVGFAVAAAAPPGLALVAEHRDGERKERP